MPGAARQDAPYGIHHTEDRVNLHYDMPLNEVIYDFFDALKSKTQGIRIARLRIHRDTSRQRWSKLDILLNKEMVDAFSMIVHESKAYARGRFVCSKLKEIIPMHQFEVPIQAADRTEGHRERDCQELTGRTSSPSATEETYRERKSCLRNRRKERSECGSSVHVEVPQEAFTAVLKYDDNK